MEQIQDPHAQQSEDERSFDSLRHSDEVTVGLRHRK